MGYLIKYFVKSWRIPRWIDKYIPVQSFSWEVNDARRDYGMTITDPHNNNKLVTKVEYDRIVINEEKKDYRWFTVVHYADGSKRNIERVNGEDTEERLQTHYPDKSMREVVEWWYEMPGQTRKIGHLTTATRKAIDLSRDVAPDTVIGVFEMIDKYTEAKVPTKTFLNGVETPLDQIEHTKRLYGRVFARKPLGFFKSADTYEWRLGNVWLSTMFFLDAMLEEALSHYYIEWMDVSVDPHKWIGGWHNGVKYTPEQIEVMIKDLPHTPLEETEDYKRIREEMFEEESKHL
jgi:hypothetical protein